jgi:hypothetical protein
MGREHSRMLRFGPTRRRKLMRKIRGRWMITPVQYPPKRAAATQRKEDRVKAAMLKKAEAERKRLAKRGK